MLLALASLAFAAEPDLSGVNVALGLAMESNLVDAPSPFTPHLDAGLRLHVGPRLLVELGASGGIVRDDALDQDWGAGADGEPELLRHTEIQTSGYQVGGGLRLAYRLNAQGPVGFYAGVGATVVTSRRSGPWLEDVEADDEDGTVTIEEIGTYATSTREISADARLSAVHWLSDRVALTGTLTVPFAVLESSATTYTRTDGAAPYDEDVAEDSETAFGAWPRVGAAVHLRL